MSVRRTRTSTLWFLVAACTAVACTPTQPPKEETQPEPPVKTDPAPEPPTTDPPKSDPPQVEPPKLDLPKIDAPASAVNHTPRPATLAVSEGHACALVGGGRVACWGHGLDGELTPGKTESSGKAVRVAGITDAIALAVIPSVSCALRASGELTCWGSIDDTPARKVSTRALGDVVELALLDGVEPGACARRRDGTIACMPFTHMARGVATMVPGVTDAAAIVPDLDAIYVLRATGELERVVPFEDDASDEAPVMTPIRQPIGSVTDIGYGDMVCAALATGERRCWDGEQWAAEPPLAGPLWKAAVDPEQWAETADVSHGWTSLGGCSRDTRGVVSCWGENDYGQRGAGQPAFETKPRQVLAGPSEGLAANGAWTCALRAEGKLECFAQADFFTEKTLAGSAEIEGVRALTLSDNFACAIVGGGEARCWGVSFKGVLAPTGSPDGLVRIAGLSDLVQIAAGDEHVCAARRDHVIRCWGLGTTGQLGDGHVDPPTPSSLVGDSAHKSHTPLTVTGPTGPIKALAATNTASCAATDEALWCWGAAGRLIGREVTGPVQPRVVHSGKLKSLDGRGSSLCALGEAGDLWCWGGAARVGKPLDPKAEGPLKRMTVPLAPSVAVAVGEAHGCLLSETGDVWCWGQNDYGQLGDGTTIDRMAPVKVAGLGGRAVQIAAGTWHSCARLDSGAIECWGSKTAPLEFGEREEPTKVVGLAPYVIP